MADVVFKQAVTPPTQEEKQVELPQGKEATRAGDETQVEVPYLDYEDNNHKPYLAEYFRLGDTWNDPQGGFPNEILAMSKFIENKVKTGEIANSQSAVKNLLKGMERVNNLHHEERSVIKIEVLKNYMEFLAKNEDVRRNSKIYANS